MVVDFLVLLRDKRILLSSTATAQKKVEMEFGSIPASYFVPPTKTFIMNSSKSYVYFIRQREEVYRFQPPRGIHEETTPHPSIHHFTK
jgi:hypothetical protein